MTTVRGAPRAGPATVNVTPGNTLPVASRTTPASRPSCCADAASTPSANRQAAHRNVRRIQQHTSSGSSSSVGILHLWAEGRLIAILARLRVWRVRRVHIPARFRRDEPLFVPPPLLVSARHRRHSDVRRPALGGSRPWGSVWHSPGCRARARVCNSAERVDLLHQRFPALAELDDVLLDISVISGTALRANEPIAEASPRAASAADVALPTRKTCWQRTPTPLPGFWRPPGPEPVSAENKARVLSSLPAEGEVTDLNAAARQKLAALYDCSGPPGASRRYDIKVIDVPLAAVFLHARVIIFISEPALTLLDADELQALVAHEIGHEYVWAERERAFRLADRSRLKDLELMCDAIAIVTLHGLGMDVSRLMTGVQKISRFNRERFGTANNEKDYPTVAERRAFAAAVVAWISARTGAR